MKRRHLLICWFIFIPITAQAISFKELMRLIPFVMLMNPAISDAALMCALPGTDPYSGVLKQNICTKNDDISSYFLEMRSRDVVIFGLKEADRALFFNFNVLLTPDEAENEDEFRKLLQESVYEYRPKKTLNQPDAHFHALATDELQKMCDAFRADWYGEGLWRRLTGYDPSPFRRSFNKFKQLPSLAHIPFARDSAEEIKYFFNPQDYPKIMQFLEGTATLRSRVIFQPSWIFNEKPDFHFDNAVITNLATTPTAATRIITHLKLYAIDSEKFNIGERILRAVKKGDLDLSILAHLLDLKDRSPEDPRVDDDIAGEIKRLSRGLGESLNRIWIMDYARRTSDYKADILESGSSYDMSHTLHSAAYDPKGPFGCRITIVKP